MYVCVCLCVVCVYVCVCVCVWCVVYICVCACGVVYALELQRYIDIEIHRDIRPSDDNCQLTRKSIYHMNVTLEAALCHSQPLSGSQ